MILISNGTLMMIQNMTWNGAQGFQNKPTEPFYVPYHDDPSLSTLAGSGVFGTTHTERGLTWVSIDLAGHSKFVLFLGIPVKPPRFCCRSHRSLHAVLSFPVPHLPPSFNARTPLLHCWLSPPVSHGNFATCNKL
jgi:carboxypeptidase D